eukprot:1444477-Rhodomonas_salina.2
MTESYPSPEHLSETKRLNAIVTGWGRCGPTKRVCRCCARRSTCSTATGGAHTLAHAPETSCVVRVMRQGVWTGSLACALAVCNVTHRRNTACNINSKNSSSSSMHAAAAAPIATATAAAVLVSPVWRGGAV